MRAKLLAGLPLIARVAVVAAFGKSFEIVRRIILALLVADLLRPLCSLSHASQPHAVNRLARTAVLGYELLTGQHPR